MLGDLLARIHGDGGHYASEHGIEKAVADADRILAEWRAYKPAPLQQGEYLPLPTRPEPDGFITIKIIGRDVEVNAYRDSTLEAFAHAAIDADRAARGAAQASSAPVAEDADQPHGFIKPDTGTHVYFYEQDFYVLSNFSAFTLYWDDVENMRFDTSEAAYHWEKFPGHDDIRAAIINAPSAHEAFKVAERNKAHRRPDWDDVKVDVMRRILRAKVEQHEYVRRKLLATGDRILVEDSWRDNVWGWGPNRDGQNLLGKLWMEVRDELRAQAAQPEGGAKT